MLMRGAVVERVLLGVKEIFFPLLPRVYGNVSRSIMTNVMEEVWRLVALA